MSLFNEGIMKECMPIDCGALPAKDNAEKSAESLVYPEKASYTCAEGHETEAAKSSWEVYKHSYMYMYQTR